MQHLHFENKNIVCLSRKLAFLGDSQLYLKVDDMMKIYQNNAKILVNLTIETIVKHSNIIIPCTPRSSK